MNQPERALPRALSAGAAVPSRALSAPVSTADTLTAPKRFVPMADRALRGDMLFRRLVIWWVPIWIMGALTVVQAIFLIRLAAARRPIGGAASLVVMAWLGIALTQSFASVLVGVELGTPWQGVTAALGLGVLGWIFGAMGIAAGAAHGMNNQVVVRGVAWLGGMVVLLALVALIGRLAGRADLYISPAPLGMLFPHSTVARFYATAAVFVREDTLGEKMTRLILFFPWATALGLGGLGIFFISTRDDSLAWRLVGMAGGLIGVVFSWSRIAIATWLVVAALMGFLRAGLLLRLAVVGGALLALFCLPLYGIDPFGNISGLRHSVDNARAGSSMARDLIYQKSWEGFLNSPLIGHGWIGESVHPKEELPIGSHSTIYGLLYTGGLPTFLAFVVAMTATFLVQIGRWIYASTDDRRARIEVGVALTLCLLAFSPFEQIFSLTVPCLFMFLWIGACLVQEEDKDLAGSSATPLAGPGIVMPRGRETALRQGRPQAAPPVEIVRAFQPMHRRPDRTR